MTTDTDQERIAQLENTNSRLRRLLEQRDAPGELRHRLRSTIALLRAVIRRSANTGHDCSEYAAHLEDRLDAIARAQALADQYGEVSLHTLLTDELLHYKTSEGERLLLSGPDVQLKAKAGQVLALAIHELAVNAIEYGVLGVIDGRVEVCWSVGSLEPNTTLLLSWKEFGLPLGIKPTRQGFGTEVLTHMLPYDLKAETDFVLEPDGLRCTIRFPLPDEVGRIAES